MFFLCLQIPGVDEEEAVRIFIEFDKVDAAIKGKEKTINLSEVTDKLLYHIMLYQYTLPQAEFKLTILVMIGTDCT